ncbi:hypothetical protein DIPPA_29213 [Diplonema papillatum]|nr:hypothetical protein DIPPA_29213 [Diplonema papillatum]KAJ9454710.1 hypothetical protein DIPPA_29213 [Diplonema papillatum]
MTSEVASGRRGSLAERRPSTGRRGSVNLHSTYTASSRQQSIHAAENADPKTAEAPPFEGELIVHVLEAEKLRLPDEIDVGETLSLRPFVRITVGEVTHDTAPAVGSYLHMWRHATYSFKLTGPSVIQAEVFQMHTDDTPVLIGGLKIPVDRFNECGNKWLKLLRPDMDPDSSARAAGTLKLRWDFNAPAGARRQSILAQPALHNQLLQQQQPQGVSGGSGKPAPASGAQPVQGGGGVSAGAPPQGKDVRAQTVVFSGDEPLVVDGVFPKNGVGRLLLEVVRAKHLATPPDWLAFSPFVEVSVLGETLATRPQKNTTNPFYNQKFEFEVTRSAPVIFRVVDANDGISGSGGPREYATVGWAFDAEKPLRNHSVNLPLQRSVDDVEPTEELGEIVFRATYHPPLLQKVDAAPEAAGSDGGVIRLGYEPVIDGSVSIVPDDCQYVWFNMYDDHKFKMTLEQRIIEAYLAAQMKVTTPGRLRPSRQSTFGFASTKHDPVPITMDTVIKKEWQCNRARHVIDMVRICAERMSHGHGLPYPADEVQPTRIKLAEMSAMRESVVDKSATAKAAMQSLWNVFTTGSMRANPERHSTEDDFDEIHSKAITTLYLQTFVPGISSDLARSLADVEWEAEGASGRDSHGNLMLKEERFQSHLKQYVCMWCDTLTEYEVLQFLNILTPFVQDARKLAQSWRRRKSKHKVLKVRDSFRKPEHLDDLGHRIRERKQSAKEILPVKPNGQPRGHRSKSTASDATGDSRRHSDDDSHRRKSVKSFDVDRSSAELFAAIEKPPIRLPEVEDGPSPRKQKRRSMKRNSHAHNSSVRSLSSTGRRHKKKSVFEIAEDRVRNAFEMEDLKWNVVASWAKEVYGGFGEDAMDLLGMTHSEVDMLLVRLFPTELPQKHPKIKQDIVAAVVEFFQAIKPEEAKPVEMQGSQIGESEIPEGTLKLIFSFCSVPALKRGLLMCKQSKKVAGPMLAERLEKVYAVPILPDEMAEALKTTFTEEQCGVLRNQVGTGKLKSPPRLAQIVAEMACAILGHETGGYWAKFRELICQKQSHDHFASFDYRTLTNERFAACYTIKADADAGKDRQGRQLSEDMIGVSWVTITEPTLYKSLPAEMVALYKWVKLLMMTYSVHAGVTPPFIEAHDWKEKAPHEVYWD